MGFFSSIGNFLGDIFGGGGSVNPVSSVVSAATPMLNVPDLVPNLFSSSLNPSSWGNLISGAGSLLSGAAGSALSGAANNFGLGTPTLDPITVTANPGSVGSGFSGLVPQNWESYLPLLSGIATNAPGLTQSPQPNLSQPGGQPPGQQQPGQQGQPQQQPGQPPGQQPAAGGGNPITNILSGGGNGLSTMLAGLPVLAGLLKKDSLGPGADSLSKMAADIQGRYGSVMDTATANQQGMINGQATSAVDRKLKQQEAAIRQNYHQMGMSGSSMETQDLNNARMAAQDEVFKTGQEMATSGLATAASLAGLDTSIYSSLMQAQIEQDKTLSDALAEFAAAAVQPSGSTQVNVGGSSSTSPSGGGASGLISGLLGGLLPAGDPLESVINGIVPQTNDPGLVPNLSTLFPNFSSMPAAG